MAPEDPETSAAARVHAEVLALLQQGSPAAAAERGQAALSQLGDSPPADWCRLLLTLSTARSDAGQHAQALDLAHEALERARAARLRNSFVSALTAMGMVLGRMNAHAAGEVVLLQALSRTREIDNTPGRSSALNNLLALLLDAHEVQRSQGEHEKALATGKRLAARAREALGWSEQETDPFRRIILRNNIGAGLAMTGVLDSGLQLLAEGRDQASAAGYRRVAQRAEVYAAEALTLAGRLQEAAERLDGLLADPHLRSVPTGWVYVAERRAKLAAQLGEPAREAALNAEVAAARADGQIVDEDDPAVADAQGDELLRALAVIEAEWHDRQQRRLSESASVQQQFGADPLDEVTSAWLAQLR